MQRTALVLLTFCLLAVTVRGQVTNLALGKAVNQLSTGSWCGGSNSQCAASYAVDGNLWQNPNTGWCSHTSGTTNQWWRVDLGSAATITYIVIYMRTDSVQERVDGLQVVVTNSGQPLDQAATVIGSITTAIRQASTSQIYTFTVPAGTVASRYVEVRHPTNYVTLCEVQVFGEPVTNVALGKYARSSSQASLCRGTQACLPTYATDGNITTSMTTGYCAAVTTNNTEWWRVDLGVSYNLTSLVLYARNDAGYTTQLAGAGVYLSSSATQLDPNALLVFTVPATLTSSQITVPLTPATGNIARYIEVRNSGTYMSICELQAFGTPANPPCQGITCSGHGTCVPDAYGKPFCQCSQGYNGTNCETDWCNITDCRNGAECALGVCYCRNGWTTSTQAISGPSPCVTPPPMPGNVAACTNFSIYANSDFNGYDIRQANNLRNLADCQQWCQATPNCYAFEFHPNGGACWAKAYASLTHLTTSNGNTAGGCVSYIPNPCVGVTCQNGGSCVEGMCHCAGGYTGGYCQTPPAQPPTCPTFNQLNQYDLTGGSNIATLYGIIMYSDCLNECQARAGCWAFTWDNGAGICYPKTIGALGTQASNTGRVSGACTVDPCVALQVNCLNGGSCQSGACRCRNGYTGTTCQILPPNGVAACLNFTYFADTDFTGYDLQNTNTLLSLDDCINYCQATANCYAIEWQPGSRNCYAKGWAAVLAGPSTSTGNTGAACGKGPADPCQGIVCQNGGVCSQGVCACKLGYTGSLCQTPPAQPPACTSFTRYDNTGLSYSATINTGYGIMTFDQCVNYCESQTNCYAFVWNGNSCQAKVMNAMNTRTTSTTTTTTVGVCSVDPCVLMGVTCQHGGVCSGGVCSCRNGWTGASCMTAPPGGVAACTNFSWVANADFTGNDLVNSGNIATVADCQNYCQSIANCYAFEYSGNTCYAKGAAALYVSASVSNGATAGACTYKPPNPCLNVVCNNGGSCDNGVCRCTMGYTGTSCQNAPGQRPICTEFDRLGSSDLSYTTNIGTGYGMVTYGDCLNYCESQANCWVFVWTGTTCYARGAPGYGTVTTSNTNTVGRCKADPCTAMTCSNGGVCTLGVCHCRNGYSGTTCTTAPAQPPACTNFTYVPNADFNGYDLSNSGSITSAADCQNYCQSVANCYAFEWAASSSTCYAKGAAALYVAASVSNGNTAGACGKKPDAPCLNIVCRNGGSCTLGVCHCINGYTGTTCQNAPGQTPICLSFTRYDKMDLSVTTNIGTGYGINTYEDCMNYCESQNGCYAFVFTGTTCYARGAGAWGGNAVTHNTNTIGKCTIDPCTKTICNNNGVCAGGVCHCRGGFTGTTCTTAPPGGAPSCTGTFTQFPDSDFTGYDLSNSGGITSIDDCINYCQSIANCYAVEFQPGSSNCYAKGWAAVVGGRSQSAGNTAATCSVGPPSPCAGIVCQNGGTCKDGVCHCIGGYNGITCNNRANANPACLSFAKMPNTDLSYTNNIGTGYGVMTYEDCMNYCETQQNCWVFVWTGTTCYARAALALSTTVTHATNTVGKCTVDPCTTMTCGNGGICSGGVCHCRGGYSGTLCATPPPGGAPACSSFTQYLDSDFNGYDLRSDYGGVFSYDDCINYCQATANCYAIEYQVNARACYAKGWAAAAAGPALSNGNVAAACSTPPATPCKGITCQNGGSCTLGVCHCINGYTGINCQNAPGQRPACFAFQRNEKSDFSYTTNIATGYGITSYEDCVNYCQSQNGCWAFTFTGGICYAKGVLALGTVITTTNNNIAGVCTEDACAGIVCQNGGSCLTGVCHCRGGYSGSRCATAPPNGQPACTNFTRVDNFDYYGSDLVNNNQAMLTFEDCMNFCQATANCYAFHLSPATPKVCYAKGAAALVNPLVVSSGSISGGCGKIPDGACNTVVCRNGGSCSYGVCHCINGYTGTTCQTAPGQVPACNSFTRYDNSDWGGGQNLSTTWGVLSYADCLNQCQATANCYAFLWTGQICFTKSSFALSVRIPNPGNTAGGCNNVDVCKNVNCGAHGTCVSGICRCEAGWGGSTCLNAPPSAGFCKNFTNYPGIDFTGNDLSNVQNVFTITDCVLACQNTAKCMVVSLIGTTCYLKTGAAFPTKNSVANSQGAACFQLTDSGIDLCIGVTCPIHQRCLLGACVCTDGYSGASCGSAPPPGACLGTYTTMQMTDLPVGEVANQGGSDFLMCISQCMSRADCLAVTRDPNGLCRFKNATALEVKAPTSGYTAAYCDAAVSGTQTGTSCTSVNCANGGKCSHGQCYCVNGYSGTRCDVAPPAGACTNYVQVGVNNTLTGATAWGPAAGYDAVNASACMNRCHMYSQCAYAIWENYKCRMFSKTNSAAYSFKAFSTVVACYDIWPTGKARFSVVYNNQDKPAFQKTVSDALAGLGFDDARVKIEFTYAANGTALVTLTCKQQTCEFTTLGSTINNMVVNGLQISSFQVWCSATNTWAARLDQCGSGPDESSSSSLSGGAVAGIVIAVVAVVAIAVLVIFYSYAGGRSTSSSTKRKRARRTNSGSELTPTARAVELPGANSNTTAMLPNDTSASVTPKASVYAVAPSGNTSTPAPPPLPPMPRM